MDFTDMEEYCKRTFGFGWSHGREYVRCAAEKIEWAMAPSAAGMLVIMDRGFPGVALWKAYTQAGAHLRRGLLAGDPQRPRTIEMVCS